MKTPLSRLLDSAIILAVITGMFYFLGASRMFAFQSSLGLPETLVLLPPEYLVGMGFALTYTRLSVGLFDVAILLVVSVIAGIALIAMGKRVPRIRTLSRSVIAMFYRYPVITAIVAVVTVFLLLISSASESGADWARIVTQTRAHHLAHIALKDPNSRGIDGYLVAETNGMLVVITGPQITGQYVPPNVNSAVQPNPFPTKTLLINKDETYLIEVSARD